MTKAGTFNAQNNGTRVCQECGKRRQVANMGNQALCTPCYDKAGDENAVADGQMTPEQFHAAYLQHAWSCPESCNLMWEE